MNPSEDRFQVCVQAFDGSDSIISGLVSLDVAIALLRSHVVQKLGGGTLTFTSSPEVVTSHKPRSRTRGK